LPCIRNSENLLCLMLQCQTDEEPKICENILNIYNLKFCVEVLLK
jgi:hypothetical protein